MVIVLLGIARAGKPIGVRDFTSFSDLRTLCLDLPGGYSATSSAVASDRPADDAAQEPRTAG